MTGKPNNPIAFAAWFVGLFVLFYYFNIGFIGVTSPGNLYVPFLAEHLNYVAGLRWILLKCSAGILNSLGYYTITNTFDLLVAGRGIIHLAYDCLGLGLMSFFAALVLAYPKPVKAKVLFLTLGVIAIQTLNIARFILLALFWAHQKAAMVDHHTIFNILMYIMIGIGLYFWVKSDTLTKKPNAKN